MNHQSVIREEELKNRVAARYFGSDFQHNNGVFITLSPSASDLKQVKGNWITAQNLTQFTVYVAARLCIDADWLNDRDQFLYPNDGWKDDAAFQADSLVYALFSGRNRVKSSDGVNHWIPFTEEEVRAKDCFASHFMSDFINGRGERPRSPADARDARPYQSDLFAETPHSNPGNPVKNNSADSAPPRLYVKENLTPAARAVLDAGRELWRYYHAQPDASPNASYYDIRAYFQGCKPNGAMLGVWQPDNVVITLALQRVEHHVPLYVHRVILDGRLKSVGWGGDGTNAVLRFDFLAGDWLPPEGNGKHADLVIRTRYHLNEIVRDCMHDALALYDFTSAIEFPGERNGLVERSIAGINCGIRIRSAPETGYISSKSLNFGCRRKKTKVKGTWSDVYTDSDDDRCYCFRIRSRFDEKGNLVEAYYGKIYGDFRFKGTDRSGFNGMSFLYYLNPTSLDRNLEWDMKNNLCEKPLRMDYEPIGVRYREP